MPGQARFSTDQAMSAGSYESPDRDLLLDNCSLAGQVRGDMGRITTTLGLSSVVKAQSDCCLAPLRSAAYIDQSCKLNYVSILFAGKMRFNSNISRGARY